MKPYWPLTELRVHRAIRAQEFFGFLAVIAEAFLLLPSSVIAIPILTPHTHKNPNTVDQDTTWINPTLPIERIADPDPDQPDAKMHQHRDRDALTGGNNQYVARFVWDNDKYRTAAEFGHGYQETPAYYSFVAAFPAAGRTDFDNAVIEWETKVNGKEKNVNGVPITILMDFESVTTGVHEMEVLWADIASGAESANWNPNTTDFTFDSNPTVRLTAAPGEMYRTVGGTCGPFIDVPTAWHFGGTGDLPQVQANYEFCAPDGSFVPVQSQETTLDFYTYALHELGHAWGLEHFGSGIMRQDIGSIAFMRDPDAGSIDGMKDLYAIPTSCPTPRSQSAPAALPELDICFVPEPSTGQLLLGAFFAWAFARRRLAVWCDPGIS